MSTSGIIRKVDDLGRIVIPIEIRKLLNIKEGENLEFSINDNSIVLVKKSIMLNNLSILQDIENSIRGVIDGNYIITDREKILFASNSQLLNLSIGTELSQLLSSVDEYSIIKDQRISNNSLYVFSYYYENNKSGFIILYDIVDIDTYSKLIKFISSYINNKLCISQ